MWDLSDTHPPAPTRTPGCRCCRRCCRPARCRCSDLPEPRSLIQNTGVLGNLRRDTYSAVRIPCRSTRRGSPARRDRTGIHAGTLPLLRHKGVKVTFNPGLWVGTDLRPAQTCRQHGGGGASRVSVSPPRLGHAVGAVVPPTLLHAPPPLRLPLAMVEYVGGAKLPQVFFLHVLGSDPRLLVLPAGKTPR